jgi:neutral ceramidase
MFRRNHVTITTALLAMVLGSASLLFGAPLRAGVARVDITPPVGMEMWGFGARKLPSEGTIDPLYARVLVLEASDKRIAIVALDLGRSFGAESLAMLRTSAKRGDNIDLVVAAASHTHAGPMVSDHYAEGKTPSWETQALEKIAHAIHDAASHLVEARIGAGYGSIYLGYNRLESKLPENYQAANSAERFMSSPIDPTVAVLRIDTSSGTPLAILVNYACHPVVYSWENIRYSADYPAVMAKTVESAFDAHPMAFFLQGAPGDIDPYYADILNKNDPEKGRVWTGQQLGEEAVRVARKIEPANEPDGTLDFADEVLNFRLRWDPATFHDAYIRTWGAEHADQYFPGTADPVPTPVSTILINKRIAFAVLPGEPFVELQQEWRKRCPVPNSFFLGYSNGYLGYLPTIRMAARGGYGAASGGTWLEVGAGDRIVNNAIIQTYRMLGRFSPAPE